MADIRLQVLGISESGDAYGRHNGKTILLDSALPGEVVEVALTSARRAYARGHVTRVLQASPERIDPPCPHAGRCGGCDWQHVDYAAQLRFKAAMVRTHLITTGKQPRPQVLPCTPCPQPFGYRNRMQLMPADDAGWGYADRHTQAIVPVEHCLIADRAINAALQPGADVAALRVQRSWRNGQLDLRAAERIDGDVALVRVADHDYRVSADSFFQVNTAMTGELVRAVLHALDLHAEMQVLDLYCGVGLFTLPISSHAALTVGVESSSAAAADARINAPTARIVEADVAEALAQPEISHEAWDAIVLDPPRAGLSYAAVRGLIALRARRLVYVSCDPATLARDVSHLHHAGYALRHAQPIDMFPQTRHVEVIAVLERG